jgi:ATP-dependent DNA helicase DinG
MTIAIPPPSSDPAAIYLDDVDRALGPDGILSTTPGFQYRPGQHRVARLMAQTIGQGGKAIVEAGTGIGKALSHVIPAVRAALEGQRVVIAVGTNHLVEQIKATVPLVAERVFGHPDFRFAVLKGRRNYPCYYRALESLEYDADGDIQLDDSQAQLLDWVLTDGLDDSKSGQSRRLLHTDLTQYPGNIPEQTRRLAVMEADRCKRMVSRRRCPHVNYCPLLNARSRALVCRLVVTNFDLLFLNHDIEDKLMGPFDTIIIDEAHELHAKALDHLTEGRSIDAAEKIVTTTIAGLLDTARKRKLSMTDPLETFWENAYLGIDRIRQLLTTYALGNDTRLPDDQERVKLARRMPSTNEASDIAKDLAAQTRAFLNDHLKPNVRQVAGEDESATELLNAHNTLASSMDVFHESLLGCEDGPYAVSVAIKRTRAGAEQLRIERTPLGAGFYLKEVFENKSVVCCSATLTADGTWSYPIGRLGMPDDVTTWSEPSPFDFKRNARLFVPKTMPTSRGGDRQRHAYNDAALQVTADLIDFVGGRAIILCSRRDDVRFLSERLPDAVPGYRVLAHVDDRTTLNIADEFKRHARSVIVGSKTFGTGFDAPGNKLIVIWKLPFSPISAVDEALQQRMAGGQQAWRHTIYNPDMAITLKQWIGRGVRREQDRCLIAILDQQAVQHTYRRFVDGAVPRQTPRISEYRDVEAFVKEWER